MTDETRKQLFKEQVTASARTYFFDVERSGDGTKCLVISEVRQVNYGYECSRIMILEENLEAFAGGLAEAIKVMRAKPKAYTLDNVRRIYPRAYAKWTAEEDERLKEQYQQGIGIPELAKSFQRKQGAIRSRLAKQGLIPHEHES